MRLLVHTSSVRRMLAMKSSVFFLVLFAASVSALYPTPVLMQRKNSLSPLKVWGAAHAPRPSGNLQLRGGGAIGPVGSKEWCIILLIMQAFYAVFSTFFPEAFLKKFYGLSTVSQAEAGVTRWFGLTMLNMDIFFWYMIRKGGMEMTFLKFSFFASIFSFILYVVQYNEGLMKSKDGFYTNGIFIPLTAYQIWG